MKQTLSVIAIIALFFVSAVPAGARFYDGNDILTDAELFDSNALSRTAIQTFLESKNSVLAATTDMVGGVPKLVSEIVYEVGKQYGISQKFLLAKLQQEQGLFDKASATQKQLDWATGYSCFSNRCNEKYRGIHKQLDAAADTQRIYAERTYFDYAVGRETKTSDGYLVTPENQATANLYIYTPYHGSLTGIGGNFFFSRIWNQYFTERVYPDGTVLRDMSTNEYWKVEGNKLRKFASPDIFLADYALSDAIDVPADRMAYYDISEPITLANNVVVSDSSSGLMYLISDGQKHRLIGARSLASLGYHLADTTPVAPVLVAESFLEGLPEGEPITEQSAYPKGILLKSDGPEIFYVKHGMRHLLLDEAVWRENFNAASPVYVSQSTLSAYPPGDPIALAEGSLVKNGSGDFYIVSNGKRKRIASSDVAARIFGSARAAAAPVATNALLSLTEVGDPIEYINDAIQDPAIYISYAERTGSGANTPSSAPATQSYLSLYDTVAVPDSMIAGSSVAAKVSFRNRGSVAWKAGSVYLKLIDENSSSSSFVALNRIPLGVDVASGGTAEFSFAITAPATGGAIREWFILEYTDASGNIVEMPGGLVGKVISTVSGVSGQITGHNIPIAVRNK
ncbi:MAG: hypothetical protein Q8P78_00070, partial [bacterium]|nr:hypothetical protein [bacterium]